MKTLLTGKPYVNAAETDLRATFRRIRKEQKAAAEAAKRDAEEQQQKVRKITNRRG